MTDTYRSGVWLQVFIDTESVRSGTLIEDWKMLPPKEIAVRPIGLPHRSHLCVVMLHCSEQLTTVAYCFWVAEQAEDMTNTCMHAYSHLADE